MQVSNVAATTAQSGVTTASKAVKKPDNAFLIGLANALAGATGGVTAMAMIYPLDIIRCRLQAEADVRNSPPVSTHQRRNKEALLNTPDHLNKPLSRIREDTEEHSSCESGVDSEESKSGPFDMDGSMTDLKSEVMIQKSKVSRPESNNRSGRNSSGRVRNNKRRSSSSKSTSLLKRHVDRSMIGCARRIVREEGVRALYRAIGSSLIGIFLSDVTYFFVVSFLKQKLYGSRDVSAIVNLKVACIAGIFVVFLTTPYWTAQTQLMLQRKRRNKERNQKAVMDSMSKSMTKSVTPGNDDPSTNATNISTTINSDTSDVSDERKNENKNSSQMRNYSGIVDALRLIHQQKGINGLFKGLGPALLLVSNPIIQFVSYEWMVNLLKNRIRGGSVKSLTSVEYFILGAIAKALATLATYPLQVAKTMLQKRDSAYSSMFECGVYLMKQAQNGDIGALYSGLGAKLTQTVSNAAIKFMIYEKVLSLFLTLAKMLDSSSPPSQSSSTAAVIA